MGVLGDNGWCFCSGGGKSERIKGIIFSGKASALASISGGGGVGGGVGGGSGRRGTGFLIHRSLLLTTHANIPSVTAAEAAKIRIHRGRVLARLVPHRFFITSSVLDLTIVGLDTIDSDSTSQGNQPEYLKTCLNSNLDHGSIVYLLGHTEKRELTVGEGKVVIATDSLIKLSTDEVTWCPGSAGFDAQGNVAFMVCDPMKLATSPAVKSSSASSSSSLSWKKDFPMQFGIPMPIIRDWLHQHWEGSLDELSKPRLPIIRLMSTGQKSERSCTSFTQRQVFKQMEGENGEVSSTSQIATKSRFQLGSSSSPNVSHDQGIPTPEIYESPKLTSGTVRRTEISPTQFLDINSPPRVPTSIVLPLALKQLLMNSDERNAKECKPRNPSRENAGPKAARVVDLVGSCQDDCCSEVQSSSSPLEASELRNEIDGSSSGEETMYSAETMESRNIPIPRESKFQQVGRSQSCVNYNRWGSNPRNSAVRKEPILQKQRIPVRKTRSQAAPLPQRSHDYYSPTVSSSMKKRNSSEQPMKPRQSVVLISPRVLNK